MARRGGILGAASIPFIGCVTLLLAMILQILTFASPFWAADDRGDFGLWRRHKCDPTFDLAAVSDEECYKNLKRSGDEWLTAARVLESVTIFFWAIPLVILPVYIYVALGLYYRCLLGTMTAFTFMGVLCCLAGVVVFGVKVEDDSDISLRWCLPVCGGASFLGLVAFIIFLVATCNRPKFHESQPHFTSGYYVDPHRNRLYVVENVDSVKNAGNGSVIVAPGQVNPVLVADD